MFPCDWEGAILLLPAAAVLLVPDLVPSALYQELFCFTELMENQHTKISVCILQT